MTEIEKMAREELNKYNREWRAKNKERVKEYNKKYWENRAKKLKQQKAGA